MQWSIGKNQYTTALFGYDFLNYKEIQLNHKLKNIFPATQLTTRGLSKSHFKNDQFIIIDMGSTPPRVLHFIIIFF